MSKKQVIPSLVSIEQVESKVYQIRNKKVMLDHDLSTLYGVPTKVLKQSVKRNLDRFPQDFMFELTKAETINWRSQFVTSNLGLKMGLRHVPFAFTEQGVAMLSSVLNSKGAIYVNIQIMRAFVRLKDEANTYRELWLKIDQLEKKYDTQFQMVFKAIKLLLEKTKDKQDPRF